MHDDDAFTFEAGQQRAPSQFPAILIAAAAIAAILVVNSSAWAENSSSHATVPAPQAAVVPAIYRGDIDPASRHDAAARETRAKSGNMWL